MPADTEIKWPDNLQVERTTEKKKRKRNKIEGSRCSADGRGPDHDASFDKNWAEWGKLQCMDTEDDITPQAGSSSS